MSHKATIALVISVLSYGSTLYISLLSIATLNECVQHFIEATGEIHGFP